MMKTTMKLFAVLMATLFTLTATSAAVVVEDGDFTSLQMTEPQREVLQRFERVEFLDVDSRGIPTFITGRLGRLATVDTAGAIDYLDRVLPLFRSRCAVGFEKISQVDDELGQRHIKFQQTFNGLPVVGAQMIVHVESKSGEVVALNGAFLPDDGSLPLQPELDARTAIAQAAAQTGLNQYELLDAPQLTYLYGHDGQGYLAWSAVIASFGSQGQNKDRIFADAITGKQVGFHGLQQRERWREIRYSPFVRRENDPPIGFNDIVNKAFTNFGTTYNYFATVHGRDSFDKKGQWIIANLNVGGDDQSGYACWDPETEEMNFANAQDNWGNMADALDVVAHEFTHGVTQHTAGLIYEHESGALNETISDVFGACVESWNQGGIPTAKTWNAAEDVYTLDTPGDALRYMNDPFKDGKSADYYPGRHFQDDCIPNGFPANKGGNDHCGVHTNSGIGNLAFYLLVQGGTHPRSQTSINVAGIGFSKAEKIFYKTLTGYMTSRTGFADVRNGMVQVAADLYPFSPSVVSSVKNAWSAVGVDSIPVIDSKNPIYHNLAANLGKWLQFKIIVPAGQARLFAVATRYGTGNADLYVRRSYAPTLSSYDGKSQTSNSRERVVILNPTSGTWYIGLYAASDFDRWSLAASYDTVIEEKEPNNSRSSAQTLSSSGKAVAGAIATAADVDYFKISLPPGKTLTVTLTGKGTDWDLHLQNSSGTVLAKSEYGEGALEYVSYTNSSSSYQTLYLKVFGKNGDYYPWDFYRLSPTW